MFKILFIFFLLQFKTFALPDWVSSPETSCPSTELCVVGEGESSLSSESAARESLAKVFSTHIKSSQTIVTSSESETGHGAISGSVSEDTYGKIVEFTEEVIEGSIVKERFEENGTYFTLVSLDKTQTSSIFEDRMKEIDIEVSSLVSDGKRSSLNKALKKLKLRSSIHDKYRILRDKDYAQSVNIADVLKLKQIKKNLKTKVVVQVKEISKTKEILKSIKFNLSENDFILTQNNEEFKIVVTLIKEPMYMKVRGFVKYKFILNIKSFNHLKNEIGSLKYEIIQTGRTENQSYQNAVPGIITFINEKFDELNID